MPEPSSSIERVLVIKLGALGDFIQALGPCAAIRRQHPRARLTLLTTAPFKAIAESCPYFDEVWIDRRPRLADPFAVLGLRRCLRAGRFDRVYDLQTSDRSGFYYRLMGPGRRPNWSGIAAGCSLPHANPNRNHMHTVDRQRDQLAMAGIGHVPATDLSWLTADLSAHDLGERLLLLVPGGSAHRPEKRWPAAGFGELARWTSAHGLQPIVLGGPSETPLAEAILAAEPSALDLTGKTDFAAIAALARRAAYAVGNDTGPMHIIAASGCPATVLFSHASDPALAAPRGPGVTILRRPRLADLSAAEVEETVKLG